MSHTSGQAMMDLRFLCVVLLALRAIGQHVKVVESPSTLLLPVNKNGTFSCKAQCDHKCAAYWRINGSDLQYNTMYMAQMHQQFYGNTSVGYILTLTVNASNSLNNTRISCRYEATGNRHDIEYSTQAYLFVISKSPISPNPSLERNVTHLTLLWSPPFLWPGHRINLFNISITNTCCYTDENDGDTEYHIRNSSYDTELLSIVHVLDTGESHRSCMFSCNNITFSISAVDKLSSKPLRKFFMSESVWTMPSSSIFTPSIFNTSVLFKDDRTPAMLKVYIQLYGLECICHEMNLTLVVRDEGDDVLTEVVVNSTPYNDSGCRVIKEFLAINLQRNKFYSLQLKVEAYGHILMTHQHYIRITTIDDSNCKTGTNNNYSLTTVERVEEATAQLYKVGLSILASMTAFLLSTLFILLACFCISHKRKINETVLSESKVRACNAMVHNPIYDGDGPVYERVHNQQSFDHLATDIKASYSAIQDDSSMNAVRYIDQPVCFHNNTSDINNITFNSTNPTNTTTRVSVLSTSSVALNKSGKKRNKSCITLSLPENNSHPPKGEAILKLDTDHSGSANETHTEMSPAGMLCLTTTSASDGDSDVGLDAAEHM